MLMKPDSCLGCPLSCSPYGSMRGFSTPSGEGNGGVLLVAEALGENELEAGIPLVGKAGYYLFQNLKRVDIERDDFTLFNVVACRPPNNKLAGMPYEAAAIAHCAPNLDAVIEATRKQAQEAGKVFTIFTLGKTAFKRIMGIDWKDPILRVDYLCYAFWSERYGAWVIAADHPAYLMRGNHNLLPILQFAAKRALEIASGGFAFHEPAYMRDPDPGTFAQWAQDYEHTWWKDPDNTILSYDIETPHKQGVDEEEVAREDDTDYTILRCAFAYKAGQAVSVPWRAEYKPVLEELFSFPGQKVGWNNKGYDDPRIRVQMPIHGDIHDGMLMWHVLNTALPKGLGFVTPFYAPDMPLWKHLSKADPAGYNAQDADAALRNFHGIRADLIKNGLWPVYHNHVVRLDRALTYMSEKGVLLDQTMRGEAEKKLQDLLDCTEIKMEASIPEAARKYKVFKKTPKDTTGMIQVEGETKIKACPSCGVEAKAAHFKSIGKKKLKAGEVENPCVGQKGVVKIITTSLWAKSLDFKVSKASLTTYQKALRHQAIISRRERKVTFDESAITRLIKKYPSDPLYPLILEHREYQKLLSTYIGITQLDGDLRGGMPIGKDGRIHTTYSHNPSTLRLASQNPNLQNLPRAGREDDLQSIIRSLIIAEEGSFFLARDYSGIEAVLVGYFAMSPTYIRLAKMDVHSFYTAYALNALDGRVATADLPLTSWSDEKLGRRLAEIKKEFKSDRNSLYKHLIHGANFAQTPKGAQEKIYKETGIEFPVKKIAGVMGIYFELFPEIKKWHSSLLLQAEKDGFLRNPFGYIHRFNKVYDYHKEGGTWEKSPGPDANRAIAFLPQSTAAGMIKEALMRLYYNRFEEAGQFLRLQVHDEIFSEVPEGELERVDLIMKEEMERPVPELRLPHSYGMGDYLIINTEGKSGKRWGSMR